MAWEENSRICLHMQLIAILSKCSMMNAKGFRSGTRSTMEPTLDTMCNTSSGSSASLVSSFSA